MAKHFEWPEILSDGHVIERNYDEDTRPPTAQEIQQIIEDARQSGLEQAREEARAEAAAELEKHKAELNRQFQETMVDGMARIQQEVDGENDALVAAIQWLCRETCEKALMHTFNELPALDPLINKLMEELPPRAREVKIFLHPDQAISIERAEADPRLKPFEIRIDSRDGQLRYDPIAAVKLEGYGSD